MGKRNSLNSFFLVVCGVTSILVALLALRPYHAWSMGTPPFDADLRSSLGAAMKASLSTNKCLGVEEAIEVISKYRKLKTRTPIADKQITATIAFPGRDSKGSRLITVSYTLSTNADGEVTFSIPMSQALADATKALRTDRFYRGVKRVRGRINISLSTEDIFKQSIRIIPARGFDFKICRNTEPVG